MMRIQVITLALALHGFTAAAIAQAPPPPSLSSPAQTGTAIIRGRIVAADTGKPLKRARVAFSGPAIAGPPVSVNTNADGRYEVRDLPAGRYNIQVTRSGYLQMRYGQRQPLDGARPLQVADGQTIERVDFALPRMGFISGYVTDETGDAVAGAMVFAMRSRSWMGRRHFVPSGPPVRSDDSGQYRVSGLGPGAYIVRATSRETWTVNRSGRKDVMAFAATYYPGTPELREARLVQVGIAQHVEGIGFRMVPGRTVHIAGTAFDSHGRPLSGVSLAEETIGPMGGTVGIRGSSAVAPDGTFTIRDVSPGEYTLITAGSDEVVRTPVVVADADIDNVALNTTATWSASGTIVTDSGTTPDFPREHIRVGTTYPFAAGMHVQGEPMPRQVVNDDWTFSITGIVGSTRFRVTLPQGWMVKSIMHDGRDVTDDAVEMSRGEPMSGLQIVVTNRMTTVGGKLVDDKGAPVDANVLVFASDSGKWFDDSRYIKAARPDSQGQYQIEGLPRGDYLAVALPFVEDGVWNDPDYLESIRRDAEKLTLSDGESRTIALKVTMPR